MPDNYVAMSLGSNTGNRLSMLSKAIYELSLSGFSIDRKSRVWETLPWGFTDQPRFLNMCITAFTVLEPDQMLSAAKEIEARLGRSLHCKWGPREIDIDILLVGNQIIDTQKLTVPHPFMHERVFVLVPLLEIVPSMVHPILKKSLLELYKNLPAEKIEWITEL